MNSHKNQNLAYILATPNTAALTKATKLLTEVSIKNHAALAGPPFWTCV
jgi:hypothetical protein